MRDESTLDLAGTAGVVRRRVAARLAADGVPNADVDAGWLVAEVCGTSPAMLALTGDLTAEQSQRLAVMVERRAGREPLQHILGSAPFRHLGVAVGPGVFVPRPETEVLVDLALSLLAQDAPTGQPVRVVDLCAGSGVIPLALGTERQQTAAWAVELDADALTWLRRNVDAHRQLLAMQGSAVTVVAGDATAPPEVVPQGVDMVTCNPPYIPDDAVPRDPEVARFDPPRALYGGPDGLDVVRGVVATAAGLLRPGGWLLIEHGDEQGGGGSPGAAEGVVGERVTAVGAARGGSVDGCGVPGVVAGHGSFTDINDHRDHSGRPRVTVARRL